MPRRWLRHSTVRWRMTRHSTKNRYLDVDGAQRAAAKYTQEYKFKMRWYLCDECSYYHISTVRQYGIPVLSLEALQRRAGD